MAIIVVSTQMGAGGPEIGMALAQKCGYRYVDQELLQDAGRRYGLAEERLSHLDESKPTIFERFDAETRHHITVLQTTLLELAELDNAVFMRGGGQWLLRGVPHVLRLRLIAPFEHRVKQWIKRVAAMTGETANQRAAADFVRRDDTEKAGRMRYLYEVDINDPMLYELIINTERVSHDAAVEMINTVVRRPELVTTDASRLLVATHDVHLHGPPDLGLGRHALQLVVVLDGRAVEAHDHVVLREARGLRGTARIDARHDRAFGVGQPHRLRELGGHRL